MRSRNYLLPCALLIAICCGCATNPPAESDRREHAAVIMRDGANAYARGDFGQAAKGFQKAATLYTSDRDRCDALIDLATCDIAMGSYSEALEALSDALPLATRVNDPAREIDALDGMATAYAFTRNYQPADAAITQAMKLARAAHDFRRVAMLLNSRGNLLSVQGKYEDAATVYEDAAKTSDDLLTKSRALSNQAISLLRSAKASDAVAVNRAARESIDKLPDSHDKASLLVTTGRTFWNARPDADAHRVIEDARSTLKSAADVAERINDRLMLSFALGYLGEIDESEKQYGTALDLTRRALFAAQQVQSPDAQYRWQWQIGRLLRDQGHIAGAIESYSTAIDTLRSIRGNISNGFGNQAVTGSFRDSVGRVYFEMADLLLRRADASADDAEVQHLLLAARDTVEMLKSGELEDYFQQKCVNTLARPTIEQQAQRGTAVVYLIPLADRTEMLLSTATSMSRFKSPIGSKQLTKEVNEFRERLEDRTSNRYLKNARTLYNWIIRPIEPALRAQKIDTLVFVPDGALRTVPMSALNDGKEFLIAKYAIAITPGLTLTKPTSSETSQIVSLQGGLSTSQVSGFAPLEYVPGELNTVHRILSGTELLNQSFTAGNLKTELDQQDFNYVHLASHAEFSHNERDTFLLTYDRKLSLKDLSALIQRHKFSEQPVELLTLSACQTAAGDDRAALGLAGVAIAMGARSAVATLWSVNDEASAELIQRFYASLRSNLNSRVANAKARAMQEAQMEMLRDPRYKHPYYWAPFLVIGNWQ